MMEADRGGVAYEGWASFGAALCLLIAAAHRDGESLVEQSSQLTSVRKQCEDEPGRMG